MHPFPHVIAATREAAKRRADVAAGAVAALLVLFAAMAVPRLPLLGFVLSDADFGVWLKLRSALDVIASGVVLFGTWGGLVAAVIAALFGWNMMLTTHYVRKAATLRRTMGASLFGALIGVLGVGCAACGSVLLASLLGGVGALAVIGALPLQGLEFGFLGAAVLLASLHFTSKKIADPDACKIPSKR
jgi:hypothetical protein